MWTRPPTRKWQCPSWRTQDQPPQRLQRRGSLPGAQGRRAAVSAPVEAGAGGQPRRRGACPRWSCGWTNARPPLFPARPPAPTTLTTEFLDYILAVAWWTAGRRHRPHRRPLHPPQRRHRHGGRRRGSPLCLLRGQRGGLRQRLHPLYRRRRVRPGLRDGHLDPEAARPRAMGLAELCHLQVYHPRQWPGARRFGRQAANALRVKEFPPEGAPAMPQHTL